MHHARGVGGVGRGKIGGRVRNGGGVRYGGNSDKGSITFFIPCPYLKQHFEEVRDKERKKN